MTTTAGKVATGLVVYQSVDGVTLRTGTNETLRFEADEIDERRSVRSSLMPTGLLDELTDLEWADLYAYVLTL